MENRTNVFIKGLALYDAKTGKPAVIGFLSRAEIEAYVGDHDDLVLLAPILVENSSDVILSPSFSARQVVKDPCEERQAQSGA